MIPPDPAISPNASASGKQVAPVEPTAAVAPAGDAFASLLTKGEEGEPEAEPDATPNVPPAVAAQTPPAVPSLAFGFAQGAAADQPENTSDGGAASPQPAALGATAASVPPTPPSSGPLQLTAAAAVPEGAGAAAEEVSAAEEPGAEPPPTHALARGTPGPEAPPPPVAAPPAITSVGGEAAVWRLAQPATSGAHEPTSPRGAKPTVAARDVAEQITVAVLRAADPQVELRLDPPELGRVQIRLSHADGGVQAIVLADRPDTQDFLRRNAETLQRELNEAGYAQVALEFAAGQDAPSRDGAAEARRLFAAAAPSEPAAAALAPGASVALSAGLDIRL